jgi:hypothetical protein
MKVTSVLLVSVILTNMSSGQTIDSTYTLKTSDSFNTSSKDASPIISSFYDGRGQKRWFSKEHIIIETNKLQLTSIEEEISESESKECRALLKRDTTALKDIWLRDFTLDEPQNEIQISKNPIPYYLSLYRIIEKFTFNHNVMYTTGVEYMIRLRSDGKVEEQIKRKFTHVWTRKLFTWRLSSKNYE